MVMRILVIEDDRETADYLRKGLAENGHVVDHAPTGPQGLAMAQESVYDALIVDRMLPGLDGLSVVKTLRESQMKTPVLILSALGQVNDRVRGLKAGGDDYLVKPFAFSELLARLEALSRRTGTEEKVITRLRVADLELDLLARKVTRAGSPIDLQPREFRLLGHFIEHRGEVVTREDLLDTVWGYDTIPFTRTVDTHIAKLRKKIEEDPADPHLIVTVHRLGYKFVG